MVETIEEDENFVILKISKIKYKDIDLEYCHDHNLKYCKECFGYLNASEICSNAKGHIHLVKYWKE